MSYFGLFGCIVDVWTSLDFYSYKESIFLLIFGKKKRMFEFKGDSGYNVHAFQLPFPEEQGKCLRQWNI